MHCQSASANIVARTARRLTYRKTCEGSGKEVITILDLNPLSNISADPAKRNWALIEMQQLLDSGQNLAQLGFLMQMPGFRMNDEQIDELARIIFAFHQESKAAGRLQE